MRSWIRVVGIVALAGPPAHAQQSAVEPLPYDYVFGSYALTELDAGGVELGGSIEVASRIIVFGGYHDWELGEGADRSGFQIGSGYRFALSRRLDGIAKLAFANTEIDREGNATDVDDDGLILSGELRGWIAPNIELSGEVFLDDSVGSDIETTLEFGGQYHMTGNFSVGGRLRLDDDDTTLLVGVRFYFGSSVSSTRGRRGS